MNFVLSKRKILEQNNYVLKADKSTNYWVGISKHRLDTYKDKLKHSFHIVIFGEERNETDYYFIPFSYLKDALTEDNMTEGRKRWVADIKNHVIRFRKSKIERNISEFYSLPVSSETTSLELISDDVKNDYSIENAKREIAIRLKQSQFRGNVLKNFDYKCCLSAIKEQDLLVASHIIPWAKKIDTRLDPSNGLCLFVLYDKLFDRGYFTLDDKFQVVITRKEVSEEILRILKTIEGKQINERKKYEINMNAIRFHREYIFDKDEN